MITVYTSGEFVLKPASKPYDYAQINIQYKALSTQKRCVVLHPKAPNEHRFFQQYVLRSLDAVYVHLPAHASDLSQLGIVFAEAFRAQTHAELIDTVGDAVVLADRLCAAMLRTNTQILFIDGCDGQSERVILPMVRAMLLSLPPDKRIIIKGRSFSSGLLTDPNIHPRTAVLPVDSDRMLIDYAALLDGKTTLEVRAFGQGMVMVNSQSVERWEGLLPRALFFFFVDRALVTRDEIFATFWPTLTNREATNVFHVTKRKISEILGVTLTTYSSGFYRLSPDLDLRYDVVLFQEAMQEAAIADENRAVTLYNRAIELYREEFLTAVDSAWAIRRRDEMRLLYIEALVGLARINHRQAQADYALGLFARAHSLAPEREDITYTLIELYIAAHHYDHARAIYRRHTVALKNAFNTSPADKTKALIQSIQKHASHT
jgi:DNA-binding SARP family transcriptional activator